MSQRIPWSERRFEFKFPVGVYPEFIERLRGTPARLEDRIREIAPTLLTRREGDRWSIQENAGHLLDLEALTQGRLDDFERGVAILRAADMTNRATFEARHNEKPIDAILAAFRAERTRLVDRLERLEAAGFARTAVHPRLDVPMRLIDMIDFQAHHDDFHLATITELKRAFSAESQP